MARLFNVRGAVLSACVADGLFLCVYAYPNGRREAAEWFVAPGGSGRGTSDAPFGRIQDALNAAEAGDTISVHPGSYSETLRSVRGGMSGQPIRLRGISARGSVV